MNRLHQTVLFAALLASCGSSLAQEAWESRELLTAPFQLGTPVAGNMFDIHGPEPSCGLGGSVLIEGLAIRAAGPIANLEVWTVTGGGSHVGLEQNPSAWTLVHQGALPIVDPPDQPTWLPFTFDIRIPTGNVQGFYIAAHGGSLLSHDNFGPVGAHLASRRCELRVDVGASVDSFANPMPGYAWTGYVQWRRGLVVPGDEPTIMDAIPSGTTLPILVREGTYRERIDYAGVSATVVAVRGSGATTLNGMGAGPVVTLQSGEQGARLIGFKVEGGVGGPGEGGGIEVRGGSELTIQTCWIYGNQGGAGLQGDGGGGGLNVRNPLMGGVRVHLLNTVLERNQGGDGAIGFEGGAGAIDVLGFLEADNLTCTENNGGQGTADAMNVGRGGCGGLHAKGPFSAATVVSSYFANNVGGTTLGGVDAAGGAITAPEGNFHRVTFQANVGGVGSRGGAGALDMRNAPDLSECTFLDNQAGAAGPLGGAPGALRAERAGRLGQAIVHCVFRDNHSTGTSPGAIELVDTNDPLAMLVFNSILWGNTLPTIAFNQTPPVVEHCDVEGGFPGAGNLDVDPMFVGPTSLLDVCSPCIDQGGSGRSSQGVLYHIPATDPYGIPRPQGVAPDLGIFERRREYPGLAEDFEIEILVNDEAGHFVEVNDRVTVQMTSPMGTQNWMPVFLLGEVWSCGTPPRVVLPGVYLDPARVVILFGTYDPVLGPFLLPPRGLQLAFQIPSSILGSALRLQGFLITPLSYYGYTTTSAVDLIFR